MRPRADTPPVDPRSLNPGLNPGSLAAPGRRGAFARRTWPLRNSGGEWLNQPMEISEHLRRVEALQAEYECCRFGCGLACERDGLSLLPSCFPGASSDQKAIGATKSGMLQSFDFAEIFGAGEGIRTLDPNLGKVVLYP